VKIRLEAHEGATLVIPEGRLDFGAAAGFQAQLEQVLAGTGTASTAVIVDCAGLEYVSSAGLRVFLLAARSSQRAGLRFAMCSLQPAVREVFELSGFSRVIAVYTDRGAALAAIPQAPA
jgi:anti-anti-sigma factor